MIKEEMNCRNVRQSGSALIITILLVTVLAAIAFSSSRLTISEIVQTGQLEDSELSYQAAEGCVETGLLLYRYNRDVEVPADVDGGMSDSEKQYMYIDITDGNEISQADFDNREPNKSYCALRMWHHNDAGVAEEITTSKCDQKKLDAGLCVPVPDQIGGEQTIEKICGTNLEKCYQDTDGVYWVVPAIGQDQVVEYNVEGLGYIKLKWEYIEDPGADEDKFKILFIPIENTGNIQNGKPPFEYKIRSGTELYLNDGTAKIRLKPLGGNLSYLTINDSENVKLDSKNTYIESTGYYGSAKRKLKTVIDRRTQSLLSTYDFLLYSAEEK